jgi:glycosyltransferase involved in cell wall biosynthesis
VKLTVTLITRNESSNIAACLESVAWADEIIVVDSHSTDDTVAIARRLATRVEVRDWPGYGEQKNYAAALASNDWILSLDADERVSTELAGEIRGAIDSKSGPAGYRIPRVSYYLGRWLRSTDWYPDFQLRLYDRRKGSWNVRRVHESVVLKGTPGLLRRELQHYPYRNITHHVQTIDRYTTLAAEEWIAAGRRATALQAVLHTAFAFLRNYLLKGGFRDGSAGLMVSVLNSYYVFLKFAKLWEGQRRDSGLEARDSGSVWSPSERESAKLKASSAEHRTPNAER